MLVEYVLFDVGSCFEDVLDELGGFVVVEGGGEGSVEFVVGDFDDGEVVLGGGFEGCHLVSG